MVLMFAGGATNVKKDVKTDVIRQAIELIVPGIVAKTINEE